MGEDKEHLKKLITANFNRLHNDILSLVEVVVKNDYQYQAIRAKILRHGNDALREIIKEMDYYEVTEVTRKDDREIYELDEE